MYIFHIELDFMKVTSDFNMLSISELYNNWSTVSANTCSRKSIINDNHNHNDLSRVTLTLSLTNWIIKIII